MKLSNFWSKLPEFWLKLPESLAEVVRILVEDARILAEVARIPIEVTKIPFEVARILDRVNKITSTGNLVASTRIPVGPPLTKYLVVQTKYLLLAVLSMPEHWYFSLTKGKTYLTVRKIRRAARPPLVAGAWRVLRSRISHALSRARATHYVRTHSAAAFGAENSLLRGCYAGGAQLPDDGRATFPPP